MIFLRCFLKATDQDIKFLQQFGIVPPEKLRKRDLAFWIDGAKAGYCAAPHQVFETVVRHGESKVWTGEAATATSPLQRPRVFVSAGACEAEILPDVPRMVS